MMERPPFFELVAIQLAGGEKRVLYSLQPKQLEAARHTPVLTPPGEPFTKYLGYGGAAGAGKSYLSRAIATATAILWPGSHALILRRTEPMVKDNHVQAFREEVPDVLEDGRRLYKFNGEELKAFWSNGSITHFGYLNEDKHKYRYQGLEYDLIIPEESTQFDPAVLDWVIKNRLRATHPYCRPFVMEPTNPGGPGHRRFKRLYVDCEYRDDLKENSDDYAFVQARLEDNWVLESRDPSYRLALESQPEPYRSWYLEGDWTKGMGLAVTEKIQFVPWFRPSDHWELRGAFDWGYNHPFAFGLYAISEDGRAYKVLTVTGRRMLPATIARFIRGKVRERGIDPDRIGTVQAGRDCWSRIRSRGQNQPTIAEVFTQSGLHLVQANQDRVLGLQRLLQLITGPRPYTDGAPVADPDLLFMEEPGNKACAAQIGQMPSDPQNPEDALKQDADDLGMNGDDMYDETRYFCSSRIPRSRSTFRDEPIDAWSPETLEAEAESKRQSKTPSASRKARYLHPEFGEVY